MNTTDLSLFVQIAQTASITTAAKQAGITTAAASSALKRLEQQLGVQLFIRSTRQLRITEAGEKYLFHCQQALASLQLGLASAHESVGNIQGELNISAPSDLGRHQLLAWIDHMMEDHPSLSVDLTISDSLSNLFLDKVDIALRYGKPEDSSMIAFHIADIPRITCASPRYIECFGEPKCPEALKDHTCLLFRAKGRLFNVWEYKGETETLKIKVGGNRSCDDTDIVRRWALSGHGIAYRSKLDIATDLDDGKLIPLLTQFQSPPVSLYLFCPSRNQVTPAVIAFREMLREKIHTLF